MVQMAKIKRQPSILDRLVRRKLLSFQDTDAGNAEAFELLEGHRFRYVHTSGKWVIWDGHVWIEDKTGEANRAALSTARTRLVAAATTRYADRKKQQKRIEWALGSEEHWRLNTMLKSAANIRSLATISDQYDQHPFLLTVANGTVDLRDGKLVTVQPNHLITRAIPVSFDAGATAPRWLQFLDEVFRGDQTLISFIQRAVGYSLTGDTREQCFFILFGSGANGKSTFIETICTLLGAHAETAEFSTLLVRTHQGAPRNDLARLHGARLVKAAESEHRAPLNEALIKEITGGDTIAARFLYKEHFSFIPQFKIWLVTNHKPEIRGADHAIWRRVRLIPFEERFEKTKRDFALRERLHVELPGILAWAVQGCLSWQVRGLDDAPRIEQATLEYRQESDQLGRFLREKCTTDPKSSAAARKLFEGYLDWCAERAEKPESNNLFARRLAHRGISKKRGRRGVVYQGVALAPAVTATVPATPGETN
jgi:putative DNA primase/helicase